MSKTTSVKAFHNVIEQVLVAKGYEISYDSHEGDSKAIINVPIDGEKEAEKMKKIIKRVVKLLGSRFKIDSDGEVVFVKPNGYEITVHNIHGSDNSGNYRFYNY